MKRREKSGGKRVEISMPAVLVFFSILSYSTSHLYYFFLFSGQFNADTLQVNIIKTRTRMKESYDCNMTPFKILAMIYERNFSGKVHLLLIL